MSRLPSQTSGVTKDLQLQDECLCKVFVFESKAEDRRKSTWRLLLDPLFWLETCMPNGLHYILWYQGDFIVLNLHKPIDYLAGLPTL